MGDDEGDTKETEGTKEIQIMDPEQKSRKPKEEDKNTYMRRGRRMIKSDS